MESDSGKMAVSRSEFMAFSRQQVRDFVLENDVLDRENADKLFNQQVKGATLLRSSAKEVMDLFGLLGGPAKDLVDKLAEMFPGEEH